MNLETAIFLCAPQLSSSILLRPTTVPMVTRWAPLVGSVMQSQMSVGSSYFHALHWCVFIAPPCTSPNQTALLCSSSVWFILYRDNICYHMRNRLFSFVIITLNPVSVYAHSGEYQSNRCWGVLIREISFLSVHSREFYQSGVCGVCLFILGMASNLF